jgi:hypothetical protein
LFPLLWVACVGWLRLIFIWVALKRGLLNRLEDQPIRFAFERLNKMSWMNMLSRVGLQEQWRDIDRCIESMCQMLHHEDFKNGLAPDELQRLSLMSRTIVDKSELLQNRKLNTANSPGERDFELIRDLDLELSAFGRELFSILLIPYWGGQRVGPVESEQLNELPITARPSHALSSHSSKSTGMQAGPSSSGPPRIIMAEEFIAIRYMSLIRAVLANMRHLMAFVTITFVLTMLAWTSYPFHPRQFVDWFCTCLLVILGSGIIWVLAQMHRDSILSRATDTKANVLGWDFYLRVFAYGAIPVFTWLAYEFPDVGNAIYSFVLPSTSVFK